MTSICPLFKISDDITASNGRQKMLLSSNYLGILDNTDELVLYSIDNKQIEFKLQNVQDFCWVESSHFKSSILCVISAENLLLFTTDKTLPPGIIFDGSTRKATISMSPANDIFSKISELKVGEKVKIVSSLEKNSFALLQSEKIYKYTIYPDGIYIQAECLSEGCTEFSFDAAYIAGLADGYIHIWNATLDEHITFEADGDFICPISPYTFGVIKGTKLTIYEKEEGKLGEHEISEGTKFAVVLPDKSIYSIPPEYQICYPRFNMPIFSKDNIIYTIDNPTYVSRVLDVFSPSFAIAYLCSRGCESEDSAESVAEAACNFENSELVKAFVSEVKPEICLAFVKRLVKIIDEKNKRQFAISIASPILRIICRNIAAGGPLADRFVPPMCTFRSIVQCPKPAPVYVPSDSAGELPPISKEELLGFVLEALHNNAITSVLPNIAASFPEFSPFHLFRTMVLQQVWAYVVAGQLSDAARLIEELGENPGQHFREMWRQTTRNRVRQTLYDLLHRQGLLTPADEEHHQILLKITSKYPNTSFSSARKLSNSPAMKAIGDASKLPAWQPIVDLTADFNENRAMVFPELFRIPEEPPVDSPRYFLGNIALIEAQRPQTIKMLTTEGSSVERLWILHCEHRVADMTSLFKKELDKARGDARKKLKCVKFMNKYHAQMNMYELETLLDVLCQYGVFAQYELDDIELLVVRICKNKFLFEQSWWDKTTLNFTEFFKRFAHYCAQKNLFMPFEMFVVSHPKAREIDMSDVKEPLIKFIWDLWVKRDPAAANISCMQLISKSDSTDPIELWKGLPSDSLAPLASFVWNKDPEKFKPGSPESEALSNRLKTDYPLLSSLVKGEIPHPPSPQIQPPASQWRSPIFTSKYDLELHDLIAAHFDYDFSKVFTDYYGRTPNQPPFPHFDHPELITAPSEPPYVHYVKSMLPVSAFQQAVDDGVPESKFKDLCLQCMHEALTDRSIRLAALTFIELVDLKFDSDMATDYKLAVSIFDNLSSDSNAALFDDLSKVFMQKDKTAAKTIQKRLAANEIELFLLSALLGVRCGLPLDYTAIRAFAKKARPAELLLYIDRAAEIGAHYPINDVVKIIREEMPENPLKDHLLFHLTQSLPTEEGTNSVDIPPALVVFRAVRRQDQPQHISLLQEALERKTQLYALLATSIPGADQMLCALVTILTMTDAFSFDVTNPPPHDQMVVLFMQVISSLLVAKKSSELKQALELFSDNSIGLHIATFTYSVENFYFHQAEIALAKINAAINGHEPDDLIDDELFGKFQVSAFLNVFHPLLDSLARRCAEKSQVHLFRFLQLLEGSSPSEFLEPRVRMAKVIEKFENFRKAIMQCDLLGPFDSIVSGLVLNHSLKLGQAVAAVLGTSSASATQQWLKYQYSTASTPAQVLDIHTQIVKSFQDGDEMFFVALFAALLPYAQPTEVSEILRFARTCFKEESVLTRCIDALLLHLQICAENSIEVPRVADVPSSLHDTLALLFPRADLSKAPQTISLSITSPVLYGQGALQRFFDNSIDKTIDICLDSRRVDEARMLCEWRNRNSQSILLLESVQRSIAGEKLSQESAELLSQYGSTDDLEPLLDAVAAKNGWRFSLIYLHFKAAKRLGWETVDLLRRRTSEFVESKLSVTFSQWPLVRELISVGKMSEQETADCLSRAFANHVTAQLYGKAEPSEGTLDINEYKDRFTEFAALCPNPSAVGDALFARAKEMQGKEPVATVVNILLHSSMCTSDIDECAEMLDSMLDVLTAEKQLNLIINTVTVFKDPALLPRFFQYLIAQQKLEALPHDELGKKVGRVIMNCARHVQPFEPSRYFELTLDYKLYRDHAELQMECGSRLLAGAPDQQKLQEASRHFLLALAYFLHEKCYSLSMECLKKLSLISLQLEVKDLSVLHLERDAVLQLMKTKEFPFALTIAVAYDMDTESNWAQAIFAQSVLRKGEEFLTAFQYFRPITSNLCEAVVEMFNAAPSDDEMSRRMKLFLKNIPNLVERYRIAKELKFQDQIDSMKEQNPVVCEWCERVLMNGK